MLMWKLSIAIAAILTWLAAPAYAQTGKERQEATRILHSMPADILEKVQALAQILQQEIKDGKLTDTEIQQEVLSGNLAERIRHLSPEANQLLEEISIASRQGTGPGEDSLMPLLGGLGISPK